MLAERREGAREGGRAAARPRRAVGRRRAGLVTREALELAPSVGALTRDEKDVNPDRQILPVFLFSGLQMICKALAGRLKDGLQNVKNS